MTTERLVRLSSGIRIPTTRASYGSCLDLAESIRDEGLRRPVTLWKDGTLISGGRRVRAYMMLGEQRIPAVFVDTIEEAAKRLTIDNEDHYLALPWRWSDVCRLWEVLRRLDEPAAALRADANRRRGVELRKQTQAGKRKPGRLRSRSDDYLMSVVAPPFDVSSTTGKRVQAIFNLANSTSAPPERIVQAQEAMAAIDDGATVWNIYQRVIAESRGTPVSRPRPVPTTDPVPGARQIAAWERALPQMEGLVAGLIELGPPNTALAWDQVGPVRSRLAAVRRDLEKIIKQMRENTKS